MPADQLTLSSELLKIVPIAAGAFLAILGGVFNQYMTHRLSGKREQEKLIREKAEKFVTLVYEYSDWLLEKRHVMLWSDESHETPSPLDRAWMHQQLYFPELKDALMQVNTSGMKLLPIYANRG